MKMPAIPLRTAAGRFVTELAVIVLGVLIALASQAWWENRQLEDDRRRAAAAVTADLRLAREDLAGAIRRADTILADIRWLLDPSTDLTGTADSLYNARVRRSLWEITTSDVQLPAYEDLKGSGRLSLLTPDARSRLVVLEDAIDELEGTGDDNFEYQIRNLDPWLLDNAPLRSLLDYDGASSSARGERLPDDVLRSRRVENMLLAKFTLLGILRRDLLRVRETSEEILALMSAGP